MKRDYRTTAATATPRGSSHADSPVIPTRPALPHLEEVSALLRDHLQGDWIVRIEHLNPRDRLRTLWRTWGRTQNVRQGTEAVMDSILDCHLAHPQHSIRLCAERMRPETRLVYWIYEAEPEDELRAATARMTAD